MTIAGKWIFTASMEVDADKGALFNKIYDTERAGIARRIVKPAGFDLGKTTSCCTELTVSFVDHGVGPTNSADSPGGTGDNRFRPRKSLAN